MLSKSLFISLNTIKPETFDDHVALLEFLETSICFQLYKAITNTYLHHLPVTYKYNAYKVHNTLNMPTINNRYMFIKPGAEQELYSINNFINKTIEEALEQFNIILKTNNDLTLNFNSCLINKSNLILSIEVLPRS